jgi:hypothetical protein
MTRFATRLAVGFAALPFAALAHDGHGPEAAHWHATDVWGFVVVLALAGAAVWFSRRK